MHPMAFGLMICVALAGCGGATTPIVAIMPAPLSFAVLSTEITARAPLVSAATSDAATFPTTSSATYVGNIALRVGSPVGRPAPADLTDYDALGRVALTAQFTQSGPRLTGTASDFFGSDTTPYTGVLVIDDLPAGDSHQFRGDIRGTLVGAGAAAGLYDGDLDGNFVGGATDALVATVVGPASSSQLEFTGILVAD